MLDVSSLQSVQPHDQPFCWAHIKPFLPEATAVQLAREFPDAHFQESVGRSGHYHLWDRTIVEQGEIQAINDMSDLWRAMTQTLLSPEYRATLERLMQVDLSDCLLKVRLCKYGVGNWMLPHTDRPDRVLTHIIYLTEHWDTAWGGSLQILASPEADDIVEEIHPLFNTAVMFVRSDHSYHAVAAVNEQARDTRRTILAQFVRQPA